MPNDATPQNPSPVDFFKVIQRSIFGRLTSEVMLYRQCFCDPEHVALRKVPTRGVMKTLKRVLAEAIVIGIGRLLDPAETGKRRNISLMALASKDNNDVRRIVESWFKQHKNTIENVKDLRNRFIGHLDQDTYLGNDGNDTLSALSHEQILSFFDQIDALMNEIGAKLTGAVTDHAWIGMPDGDGGALMSTLARGHAYWDIMVDVECGRLNRDSVLPRILCDFGMPDTANAVARGDLSSFPDWRRSESDHSWIYRCWVWIRRRFHHR